VIFAALVERHKSPSLAPFKAIGWGGSLTLQSCPILHRGWLTTEVEVRHNTALYSIPKEYSQSYQEYFYRYFEEKRFFDNKPSIMLVRNPIAFSDSPTLVLETQETLYSQVQFYRDNVAVLSSKRDEYIRKAVQELSIDFPHPLCMHLILVTRDDKVLITKRAPKVSYFPETWSCSVEEQLSLQDVEGGPDNVLQRWFERLLKEELGLDNRTYTKDNLRVLSVFLESEILAVSICAHAVVDLSSEELSQILEGLPRTDYEFSEWHFLSHEELLDELFRPNRTYHPTSGYRMLMALIKRFGEPRLVDIFFARERR
jgi:isopentenyldiphosphate isomerase